MIQSGPAIFSPLNNNKYIPDKAVRGVVGPTNKSVEIFKLGSDQLQFCVFFGNFKLLRPYLGGGGQSRVVKTTRVVN